MGDVHFTGLFVVMAIAFAAPLVLGFAPGLRLPSVVVELVAGIVVGPSVLGWVDLDPAIRVLALIGLAVLLFLAGLEIEFARLRGAILRTTTIGFVISLARRSAVVERSAEQSAEIGHRRSGRLGRLTPVSAAI